VTRRATIRAAFQRLSGALNSGHNWSEVTTRGGAAALKLRREKGGGAACEMGGGKGRIEPPPPGSSVLRSTKRTDRERETLDPYRERPAVTTLE
jgi:hypothetical protein